MHHPMRVTTMTDMVATEVRVEAFEILKQKNNSATKKITALSKEGFQKREQSATSGKARDDAMTYDHISNAQGRLKIMAIGSRPKSL